MDLSVCWFCFWNQWFWACQEGPATSRVRSPPTFVQSEHRLPEAAKSVTPRRIIVSQSSVLSYSEVFNIWDVSLIWESLNLGFPFCVFSPSRWNRKTVVLLPCETVLCIFWREEPSSNEALVNNLANNLINILSTSGQHLTKSGNIPTKSGPKSRHADNVLKTYL